MKQRKIFYGAKFISFSEKEELSFLVVEGGKVVYLGKRGENFKDWEGEKIDLEGMVAIPGFIDSHTHFFVTGLQYEGVELTTIKNYKELIEKLKSSWQDNWIWGWGLDESNLKEAVLPEREFLDRYFKDKPVALIRRDHHSIVLNSKAISLLNGDNMAGATLGIFTGKENSLLRQKFFSNLPQETLTSGLEKASREALAKGVTTLVALEGGELFGDYAVEILMEKAKCLPCEIIIFPQTTNIGFVQKLGLPRIGGCLLIDGSFGSHTAALSAPYEDDPQNCGILYWQDKELEEFITTAHNLGLQLAFHSIGTRAIEQLVKTYEVVLKKYPRSDHRHRIEHFELPLEKHIVKVKELGLVVSMQPAFEGFWGGENGMYARRLGKDRARMTNPFRKIIEAGIPVAGGSDSNVTPINPLLGIHWAVNHPFIENSVTRKVALEMFTKAGAFAVFKEKSIGDIFKGADADLVVLDKDPLQEEVDIRKINIVMTVKKGEIVYENRRPPLS